MATAALPFEVGQRIRTDAANTAGVPANVVGRCVRVYNNPTSTGIQWIVVIRVPDDVRGSHDYHLPSTDVLDADAP